MKCGNCKDEHGTAAMVLMCYKRAGKVQAEANGDQRSYRARHYGDRRDIFRQLKKLVVGRHLEFCMLGSAQDNELGFVARNDLRSVGIDLIERDGLRELL